MSSSMFFWIQSSSYRQIYLVNLLRNVFQMSCHCLISPASGKSGRKLWRHLWVESGIFGYAQRLYVILCLLFASMFPGGDVSYASKCFFVSNWNHTCHAWIQSMHDCTYNLGMPPQGVERGFPNRSANVQIKKRGGAVDFRGRKI